MPFSALHVCVNASGIACGGYPAACRDASQHACVAKQELQELVMLCRRRGAAGRRRRAAARV